MSFIKITVNNSAVVNAQQFARQFDHTPSWLPTINQVCCESGPNYSIGQFFILRTDYDANWPETEPFTITIERTVDGTSDTLTLAGYVTISASSATRSADSPMIVIIADVRFLLGRCVTNRTWNLDDDTNTWNDVLDDLRSDAIAEYVIDLDFPDATTYDPSNLRYEGWRTIDAIADVAYRNRCSLVYDPDVASLKFVAMAGTQAGLADILDVAKLHRTLDTATTLFCHDVGTVWVNYDSNGSGAARKKAVVNPDSAIPERIHSAWATRLTETEAEIDLEAAALAGTWFDWGSRRTARVVNEYFGALSAFPGSEISQTIWKIVDGEVFTTIDIDAPSAPITNRQMIGQVSGLKLAQALVGGIPARVGITPGSATCTAVIIAPTSGTGYAIGDLVKTAKTFSVLNWDFTAQAIDGDRVFQVDKHADNALIVSASCLNEADAADIVLYEG